MSGKSRRSEVVLVQLLPRDKPLARLLVSRDLPGPGWILRAVLPREKTHTRELQRKRTGCAEDEVAGSELKQKERLPSLSFRFSRTPLDRASRSSGCLLAMFSTRRVLGEGGSRERSSRASSIATRSSRRVSCRTFRILTCYLCSPRFSARSCLFLSLLFSLRKLRTKHVFQMPFGEGVKASIRQEALQD